MNYFSDLEFVCFGYSRVTTGLTRDRLFDYYGLQYIQAGEICVEQEGAPPWTAEGPVLFITGPGRKITYYTPEGTRSHVYLCFRGDRVTRYLDSGLLPSVGEKINITEPKDFFATVLSAVRLLKKQGRTAHGEAVLLLEKALLLSQNQPSARQQGAFSRGIIHDLVERIAEHPEYNWNISAEAKKHNLSEVHFRRLFQLETGNPPLRYILEQRIRYASHLLLTTDMRIKEIAFACGFGGEFYFSRQFTRIMKQAPTEFRNKN